MVIHKVIQGHLENNPALERLLPHIQGNLGYVFTKQDLTEIRDMLLAILPAATCAGAIALCEVTVPSQITGLEPEKTSFFKALGFATKISKVPIEILSNGPLIKTGDKVGVRKAMLLNIFPFSFGLIIPMTLSYRYELSVTGKFIIIILTFADSHPKTPMYLFFFYKISPS
ncbi:hypothetical protein AB1E19_003994 [Capra hircus]